MNANINSLLKQKLSFPAICSLASVFLLVQPQANGAINLEQLPIPAPIRQVIENVATNLDKPESIPNIYDIIQFSNGDSLHGNLLAIDGLRTVVFKSPEAKNEIEFYTTNITEIQLVKKTNRLNTPIECAVKLVNGDELPGNFVSLDKEELILNTWYGGELKIKRNTVRSVMFARESGGIIYDGPAGLEGWTTSRGKMGWQYADGAFITSRPSHMGRDLKLPNRVKISFDATWQGGLFLMIGFFADNPDELYSNSYIIQFSGSYVHVQRIRRGGGSSNIGQTEVYQLAAKNKANIEIYTDKEKKMISLFINGAFVKQWKDNNESPINGTCFHLQQQSVNSIKITNLRIEEWDGRLDRKLAGDGAPSDADTLELVNRDKISGNLLSIKDGKVKFNTSFAEMEIPLERVYSFELSDKTTEKIQRSKNEIVAYFAGKGCVRFEPEKWTTNSVVGINKSFGKFKFATEAFSRILFNPSNKEQEPEITEPMDEGEQ
ncbi:MAG: hypothetical protein N2487_03705 [Verrucomicrobiae bacterium]|nr:hypothetical protein [Verrucomicrobiae bacterium]